MPSSKGSSQPRDQSCISCNVSLEGHADEIHRTRLRTNLHCAWNFFFSVLRFLIFFLFSHLLGKCLVSQAFFFSAHRILFTLQIHHTRELMSFPFYCWTQWALSPRMVCFESGRELWVHGWCAWHMTLGLGPGRSDPQSRCVSLRAHCLLLSPTGVRVLYTPSHRPLPLGQSLLIILTALTDSRCLQRVSCSAWDEDGGRLRWGAKRLLSARGPAWRKRTSSFPDSLGGLTHEFSVHLYRLLKTSSSLFRIRNLKKAYGKGKHEKVEALKGNEIASCVT